MLTGPQGSAGGRHGAGTSVAAGWDRVSHPAALSGAQGRARRVRRPMWHRQGSAWSAHPTGRTGHLSEVPRAGGAALHSCGPPGPALGGQTWSSQTSPHALSPVEPSPGPLGTSTRSDSASPLRQRGKLASLWDDTGLLPPASPGPGWVPGARPQGGCAGSGLGPRRLQGELADTPLLGWKEGSQDHES